MRASAQPQYLRGEPSEFDQQLPFGQHSVERDNLAAATLEANRYRVSARIENGSESKGPDRAISVLRRARSAVADP
jgi:hypothetical protein